MIVTDEYRTRLKNRLFGLLCEYEKNREWRKFLDGILVELYGFSEEEQNATYLHLVHNLNNRFVCIQLHCDFLPIDPYIQ